MDWAGVLTTNMVEVIDSFEIREGLERGLFLSRWATREGQGLYRQLAWPAAPPASMLIARSRLRTGIVGVCCLVYGGVQVMHGEIGIGGPGQVDRVTAQELVVSAGTGAGLARTDRRPEGDDDD